MKATAIRFESELKDRIDAWRNKQAPPLDRSEAIRALIEKGLKR